MILESKEESTQNSYNDSSSFRGDNTLKETIPKLGVGPRSTYFSTLVIDDVMRIHPFNQMEDYGEVESNSYIFELVIPKDHIEPHPSKAKMINFQCTRNGLLMCLLLPKEKIQKFDVNLGKRFKFSKWRDQS